MSSRVILFLFFLINRSLKRDRNTLNHDSLETTIILLHSIGQSKRWWGILSLKETYFVLRTHFSFVIKITTFWTKRTFFKQILELSYCIKILIFYILLKFIHSLFYQYSITCCENLEVVFKLNFWTFEILLYFSIISKIFPPPLERVSLT